VNIQDMAHQIPAQDLLIKGSGLLGGSSAFAGLMADISHWSELAQILANLGIFIGGVTAFITFTYSIYKGKHK
jgi:hypothetical protein